MSQPEARLSKRIIDALEERFPGCYLVKNHGDPYSRRGRPDIEGSIDGFYVAVETKLPGEEPTKIQRYEHSRIRRAGGIVVVAHSVEEAVEPITDLIRWKPAGIRQKP